MKRGMIKKNRGTTLVPAWIPTPICDLLDQAVEREDTDRSKFVRAAIKEKLIRMGVNLGTA